MVDYGCAECYRQDSRRSSPAELHPVRGLQWRLPAWLPDGFSPQQNYCRNSLGDLCARAQDGFGVDVHRLFGLHDCLPDADPGHTERDEPHQGRTGAVRQRAAELQAALENSQRYGNPEGGEPTQNAPIGSKVSNRPSRFLEEKNAAPTYYGCGRLCLVPPTRAAGYAGFRPPAATAQGGFRHPGGRRGQRRRFAAPWQASTACSNTWPRKTAARSANTALTALLLPTRMPSTG